VQHAWDRHSAKLSSINLKRRKRILGRPRHRAEDNIKMDLGYRV
jgi:hypothetical protein